MWKWTIINLNTESFAFLDSSCSKTTEWCSSCLIKYQILQLAFQHSWIRLHDTLTSYRFTLDLKFSPWCCDLDKNHTGHLPTVIYEMSFTTCSLLLAKWIYFFELSMSTCFGSWLNFGYCFLFKHKFLVVVPVHINCQRLMSKILT